MQPSSFRVGSGPVDMQRWNAAPKPPAPKLGSTTVISGPSSPGIKRVSGIIGASATILSAAAVVTGPNRKKAATRAVSSLALTVLYMTKA